MAEEQDREGDGRMEMWTDERSYLERYRTGGGRRICDMFSYAR
jgi:hypothetical protein